MSSAEAVFLEKVIALHPKADGKPCVIGNCQAGWAVMILAAIRPELFGPIIEDTGVGGCPPHSPEKSAGAVHSRRAGSSFAGAIRAGKNVPHGMVKIAEMPVSQALAGASPHQH